MMLTGVQFYVLHATKDTMESRDMCEWCLKDAVYSHSGSSTSMMIFCGVY